MLGRNDGQPGVSHARAVFGPSQPAQAAGLVALAAALGWRFVLLPDGTVDVVVADAQAARTPPADLRAAARRFSGAFAALLVASGAESH